METNYSNRDSGFLLREIRKLEARLNDFLKEEEAFIAKLKKLVGKLLEAHDQFEKLRDKPEKLAALKLEILKGLKEILESESEVQHKRSHMLESYGVLMLALEEILR
jgi:chromosome segregation ATPase